MAGVGFSVEESSLIESPAGNSSALEAMLRSCVHCGLCLSACPTYPIFGTEMDGPRGRIAMLGAVSQGRVPVSSVFGAHIGRCLGCMACVTVCPSGVKYGRLLLSARALVRGTQQMRPIEGFLRWLTMKQLVPHRGRLRLLALLVTLYQASGLQWLGRRLHLLPRSLRIGEALLPPMPFSPRPAVPAVKGSRGRVGLFLGCIQEAFLGNVNRTTLRVLERNGFEVVIPPGQTCCGALHHHEGEEEMAVELARANIDAFSDADLDAIIVNAGGCGPMLREYPALLRAEPGYYERALRFSALLRDVSEFLVEHKVDRPKGRLPVRATYSDSCHLRNEMGVIEQPRELLLSIPDLELVELAHPDQCCGSAGVYNLRHPEIADRVLESKLADIAATGAEVVVVTNPGCHLQIAAGVRQAGLNIRVAHLVELLDEAYAAEGERTPC